ncbi:nucleotidyl transferase AbiEii/AbiGii toxin family protein [Inquilinus sp. CAU 1745]|uniref:nucleotidyl transferase AbiEii/AbiGii toxin family protein n=1 Tax=Inquilinus sp. CAU 1745 TaxID=3140369 RepID=UPI00325A6A37
MRNSIGAIGGSLKKQARERGVSSEIYLCRWVMDGFLRRLSRSKYARRFALKGSLVFIPWHGDWLRSTNDIDLEGLDDADAGSMLGIIADIVALPVEKQDGVVFDLETLRTTPLVGSRVAGDRVLLRSHIGPARVRLKVDVGFGHPITPAPEERVYPSLLQDFPSPTILCCTRETVVAEKLATIVEFGADNTRIRDYYDLWTLSNRCFFDAAKVVKAIRRTFARRDAGEFLLRTDGYWEAALDQEFASSRVGQIWATWIGEHSFEHMLPQFDDVLERVAEFARPLLDGVRSNCIPDAVWRPRFGWVPRF